MAGSAFVYRNQFLPGHELTVTQYSVFRQFETKLPIIPRFGSGVVKFDRFGVGGSVKYAHDGRFFGFRNRFMLGVDVELQADNRRRFVIITKGMSVSAASTRTKMCAASGRLCTPSSICATISSSVWGCATTMFVFRSVTSFSGTATSPVCGPSIISALWGAFSTARLKICTCTPTFQPPSRSRPRPSWPGPTRGAVSMPT